VKLKSLEFCYTCVILNEDETLHWYQQFFTGLRSREYGLGYLDDHGLCRNSRKLNHHARRLVRRRWPEVGVVMDTYKSVKVTIYIVKGCRFKDNIFLSVMFLDPDEHLAFKMSCE
jgi:hypothetical protein